jgi:hypothetical protein
MFSTSSQESIMEFFKEHAVKGKTDTEIVKVVLKPAESQPQTLGNNGDIKRM